MILSKDDKEKIKCWREGGFSYVFIAKNLNKKYSVIKKYCERHRFSPIVIKKHKEGKYDNLINEPVAQGLMYKEYQQVEKNKQYAKDKSKLLPLWRGSGEDE